MPITQDNELWLTKKEAEQDYRMGHRQQDRYAKDGRLRKLVLPREPGQSHGTVLVSAADVVALKAGLKPAARPAPAPRPPVDKQLTTQTITVVNPNGEPQQVAVPVWVNSVAPPGVIHSAVATTHETTLAPLAPAPEPAPNPDAPWLTLGQAARYSGLPEFLLRRAAKCGRVLAINVRGGHSEVEWRFHRDSLSEPGIAMLREYGPAGSL